LNRSRARAILLQKMCRASRREVYSENKFPISFENGMRQVSARSGNL